MHYPTLQAAALLAMVATTAAQAPRADWKIQTDLARQMRDASADAPLPVYFVMRERLGASHWFPRVRSLDLETRRRVVVRELKEHAARTQAPLLQQLRDEARRGAVRDIRSQWLANIVQAEATVDAIQRLAALDAVGEVWADTAPPLHLVADGAPGAPGPGAPGDGPAAVGADRVWALGFTGQNIVVMNADNGINIQHQALSDQLWTNPGEIPANGIDDDGNGKVDDVYGWDFGRSTSFIDDQGGHGTQTAGVMVANDRCGGVTYGIAPGAKVMTGKLLGEASQWAAVQYAIDMGAQMQTSSHSYKNNFNPPPNYMVHRDVGEASLAAGLVRTNSTSNNGGLCDGPFASVSRPFNVSLPGSLPPPYLAPNQTLMGRLGGVIGVGAYEVATRQLYPDSPCGPSAWDLMDLLAAVPTYPTLRWDPNDDDYPWRGGTQLGLLKPDVLGPTGTLTSGGYGPTCAILPFGGTSNATPAVMGCLMLWKCANPSLTPEDMAMVLHNSADGYGIAPGKENTYGAGRVDAFQGLLRSLAVLRVGGDSSWRVWHQSGATLRFGLDASPSQPACVAVALTKQSGATGPIATGLGAPLYVVGAGSTGASGEDLQLDVAVPAVTQTVTAYAQAFVDDRLGPTGTVLVSNLIEIRITP
ncbi:MAG: S8 family serine peptidase [Planctomycetota bacterium]